MVLGLSGLLMMILEMVEKQLTLIKTIIMTAAEAREKSFQVELNEHDKKQIEEINNYIIRATMIGSFYAHIGGINVQDRVKSHFEKLGYYFKEVNGVNAIKW